MSHVSDTELNDFVDGELSRRSRAKVQHHVTECRECGRRLASLQWLEAELRGGWWMPNHPRCSVTGWERACGSATPPGGAATRSHARRRRLTQLHPWTMAASVAAIVAAVSVLLALDVIECKRPFVPADGPGGRGRGREPE